MLFIAIGPDNQIKLYTSYAECIPSPSQLQSMKEQGFTFKIDGVVRSINQIIATNFETTDTVDSVLTEKDSSNVKITSRSIRCIETGQIFATQAEAGKYLHIDPAYISDAIKRKISYKGYTFEKVMK